jgi:hypothetical protein
MMEGASELRLLLLLEEYTERNKNKVKGTSSPAISFAHA